MQMNTLENLNFEFVSKEDFIPIFEVLRPKIFSENNDVNYSRYWSEEEMRKFKDLQTKYKTEIRYYLLCKNGEEVVGWSWGLQVDGEEFYMVNSAVMPEYRKRGIYRKLLSLILDKAKNDGFQIISSKHHATNNAILIPKLKMGFKIVSMKVHPRFGVLLELHYYNNEKVEKLLDYRSGFVKEIP